MDPKYIAELNDQVKNILATSQAGDTLRLAAAQVLATLHLADVVEAAAKAIADKLDAIERQLDLLRPT